ncbi:MAG: hypothetical protein HZC28_08440 [Spirochaetes bacterium]|nr:hypothetical protein [Spirochaetota bacterium]
MKLTQILSGVVSGLPCILMGARLALVWKDPLRYEKGRWVRLGVGIMVMEFIVVHSGMMMAGYLQKINKPDYGIAPLIIMLLVYALFVVTISLGFKSRSLMISFASIIAGRFTAFALSPSGANAFVFMQSAVSMSLYMLAVILSLTGLPRLGITEALAKDLMKGSGSGLWVEKPHRAIGAAAFYFFALGLADILFLTWFDPHGFTALFK